MKKLFFVALAVFIYLEFDAIKAFIDPPRDSHVVRDRADQPEVVLYATSWCGYCAKTRKILDEYGIDYYEYDIEKSDEGKRQFKQLGGKGVPVLVVDDVVLKGYNPKKIRALLE